MTLAVDTQSSPALIAAPTSSAASKNVTAEKDYWNSFYSRFNISHPSQFCVMTAIEADNARPIVEFGCGNARDSIYLATHGFTVYGCDLSKPAIEKNVEKSEDVPNLEFAVVDASNAQQVRGVIDKARDASEVDNVTIYTRFFLHSIDETQEAKFFAALSSSLIAGDKLYFEFRSALDERLDKVHGKDHYRRYIRTPDMIEDLGELGFDVTYECTGQGMAKYKDEDPFVSRLIAKKI
jgi:SAM-dependent methyltransferase